MQSYVQLVNSLNDPELGKNIYYLGGRAEEVFNAWCPDASDFDTCRIPWLTSFSDLSKQNIRDIAKIKDCIYYQGPDNFAP